MSGFTPGSEEIYTEEESINILKGAYNVLVSDETISFDTELRAKLAKEGIVSQRTFRYILNKFNDNNEVSSIKKDIDEILEHRKCKDKAMYPGIAAMALKNKHGWRDQHDFKGDIDHNIHFFEDLIEKNIPPEVEDGLDNS